MKSGLVDTIILSLSVVLLVIGTHQVYLISRTESITEGFFKSYWIFMLVIILMIIHQMRKNKKQDSGSPSQKDKNPPQKRK